MADNTTLDPGTGGDVIATDDIGGVKYQRVKVTHGADGSATDVSTASPLPVSDAGGSITVDNGGTFAVQADTELTTADLDTGAGTDTRAVVGLVIAKSGGAANVSNSDPVPISDAGGSVTVDGSVSATVTNAGTFVTQENGGALTALQLLDDTVFTDDAAFTPGTSKVNAIGLIADQASTDSVNEGDIGIPRMTLSRQQIATVTPSADSEGLDVFRSADIDETEEEVKATAGKLYGWAVYNDSSTEVFLQFWNATAANTTPGTTTPRITFPIPAGAAANIEFTNGITFDTAICVGATNGFGDAVAPGATVSGTVFYK